MTLPIPARIADAVAADINTAVAASVFDTVGFTASRRLFDWDQSYTKLDDLQVDVVYITRQKEGTVALEDAGHLNYQISIDVVALKRFRQDDIEQNTGRLNITSVDPLVRLLEEIGELFAGKRNSTPLDTESEVRWISGTPVWCDQAAMREGVFAGAVRLTFDYRKAI